MNRDRLPASESVVANPLFGVEVRHLAALSAIARTRSFSRAGAELGYAQSAISQQLAALERAVGHRLVERPGGPKPVSLTPAGEMLLQHAESITARLAAAKADLDALANGEAGVLRVGAFQSAEARLLPPTLGRLRERFPAVECKLRSEGSGEALEDLALQGTIDLAFTDVTSPRAGLGVAEILVDPYVVLVPPGNPLAHRLSVDLADLRDQPMIGPTPTDRCSLHLLRAYAQAGFEPAVVFRTDDNLTIQRLVGSGLGCAVMPSLAVEAGLPGSAATVRPLSASSAVVRRVGIVWNEARRLSKPAAAFVDAATEVAAAESARLRAWEARLAKPPRRRPARTGRGPESA